VLSLFFFNPLPQVFNQIELFQSFQLHVKKSAETKSELPEPEQVTTRVVFFFF
jgi:hypothetical protein